MALPDLTSRLTAKTDGFEAALNRAAKATEDNSRQIVEANKKAEESFNQLKKAFGGVLTVAAFTALVKGAIDAADHLNDLSKKTGIAVETLGGLGFAAQQSGSSLDAAASGFTKLNKTIAEAAAGNKSAVEAFKAINVSVRDASGNIKSADRVFAEIADRFASYEDGPNKAALAIRLFGKAGADLIPLLDEGGKKLQENVEYYKRYSGVTEDLAARADQFNDTMAKLGLLQGAFGKQLAAELLPTLQTLANLFVESKEKGTAFATIAEVIGDGFRELVVIVAKATYLIEEFGRSIGAVAAKAASLTTLDFSGFSAISDAAEADGIKARKALDQFVDDVRNAKRYANATLTGGTFDQEGSSRVTTGKIEAPALPPATRRGGAGASIDLNKKLLDQQLKQLDQAISQEKDLFKNRESFLQTYYQRDDLSAQDYFAGRQNARDAELASIRDTYAKEIAAVEAYIATVNTRTPQGQGKVIEAQTKIIDITEKLRKVEADATTQGQKDWFALADAVQRYNDKLVGLQAQLDAIAGRSAETAGASFDAANRSLRKQIDANIASSDAATRSAAEQAREQLDALRQQAVVAAELGDVEKRRSVILGDLSNAQERINIAVSSGAKTELAGLVEQSQANAARLASLQQVVEAYERIADVSLDPLDRVKADQARVELEKLAAQTDLIGDKFREIGKSATENFIDKLASGTATLKDAFKGFFADINRDLIKLGSRQIAQSLFAKNGALGGLIGDATDASKQGGNGLRDPLDGDFLGQIARLFGLGGETAGASVGRAGVATAANDAAFATLTATVTASDASLTLLTEAAASAAATLDVLAASSAGDSADELGSLLSIFASAKGNVFAGGNVVPFARGGVVDTPTVFPMRRGYGLVGEAGREAVVPLRATDRPYRDARGNLRIDDGMRGTTIINNVNVHAPQSRDLRSPAQAGRTVARQLASFG